MPRAPKKKNRTRATKFSTKFSPPATAFSEAIQNYRAKHKMSMYELGFKIGCSPKGAASYISGLERFPRVHAPDKRLYSLGKLMGFSEKMTMRLLKDVKLDRRKGDPIGKRDSLGRLIPKRKLRISKRWRAKGIIARRSPREPLAEEKARIAATQSREFDLTPPRAGVLHHPSEWEKPDTSSVIISNEDAKSLLQWLLNKKMPMRRSLFINLVFQLIGEDDDEE